MRTERFGDDITGVAGCTKNLSTKQRPKAVGVSLRSATSGKRGVEVRLNCFGARQVLGGLATDAAPQPDGDSAVAARGSGVVCSDWPDGRDVRSRT